MDWLLEIEAKLAEQVYWATADLLNLEIDLLFFDTTSTSFERDERDRETVDEDGVTHPAFCVYGHSKDHREDLPQVVVGLAVTRSGIPICAWCWPENTADQPLIGQVNDELREWKLSRVVWVADRGFQSAENRRYLQRAGGHYIIGEKLRGESKEAKLARAVARQGRYHPVAGNLQVKEVRVDDGTMRDRFVICRNPDQAERDQRVRDQLVAQLVQAINDSDRLSAAERAKLYGRLQATRGLTRYLRQTKGALLRIDRAAINAEAHLDGKFLLRSSDPTLSAQDIALGYKQLLQVERAWRDMKTTLDLRPVHHRKEDRIRAHVQLCWLALLLIGIAENQADDTWRNLRRELQRLHQGSFRGTAGEVTKTSEPTHKQQRILTALGLDPPPAFPALAAAA
jgi:transposase